MVRRIYLVTGRHDEAVGLHRAVDARHVAADNQTRRRGPRSLFLPQQSGTFQSLLEQSPGNGDLADVEKLIVGQRKMDRLLVDLYVRQQLKQSWFGLQSASQSVDLFAELMDA